MVVCKARDKRFVVISGENVVGIRKDKVGAQHGTEGIIYCWVNNGIGSPQLRCHKSSIFDEP